MEYFVYFLAFIGTLSLIKQVVFPIVYIILFSMMYVVFTFFDTDVKKAFKKRPFKVFYAFIFLIPFEGFLKSFEGFESISCKGYRWTPLFKIESLNN